MQYVIGFVLGLAVCAVLAKGYIMKVVADEKAVLSAQYNALKAAVDTRVASVRQTVANKVAGK